MNVYFETESGKDVIIDTDDVFAIRLPERFSDFGRIELRVSAQEAELLMQKVLWVQEHESAYDGVFNAIGQA